MIIINLLSRKRYYIQTYCLFTVAILLIASCEKEAKSDTYIAGKIINPHLEYVTIKDFNGFNDTIPLSDDGSFSKSYNYLSPGFYTFSHPRESQTVYLSPGDSTVLRLNTKAFDESLAFSGSHAKENNYLINLFIQIEEEERMFLENYRLPQARFKRMIDSITSVRLTNLESHASLHNFDKNFLCHADEVIKFSSWSKIERYSMVHYGKNNFLNSEKLPASFYDYRKDFKIENKAFLNNVTYRPYINALISNLTFKSLAKELGSGILVNHSSLKYHKRRLHIIDSLFSRGIVKDIFASNSAQYFIANRKNASEITELVNTFTAMTEDEALKTRITDMASTYIKLDPGNEMPNIKLQNTVRNEMNLSERVTKLSVLFFWSDDDRDYARRVHDQIKDLRVKYPEIEFLGINLDDSESKKWQSAYERYNFDPATEYQILNTSPVTAQLALRNNNRSMVIDENLTIIDPSINLFHFQIETTLLGYINK